MGSGYMERGGGGVYSMGCTTAGGGHSSFFLPDILARYWLVQWIMSHHDSAQHGTTTFHIVGPKHNNHIFCLQILHSKYYFVYLSNIGDNQRNWENKCDHSVNKYIFNILFEFIWLNPFILYKIQHTRHFSEISVFISKVVGMLLWLQTYDPRYGVRLLWPLSLLKSRWSIRLPPSPSTFTSIHWQHPDPWHGPCLVWAGDEGDSLVVVTQCKQDPHHFTDEGCEIWRKALESWMVYSEYSFTG